MSETTPTNERSNPDTAVSAIVQGACCAAGIAATLAGDAPSAGLAFSAAGPAAISVAHLQKVWTEISARRIFRSAQRVRERVEAEGLHADPEEFDDTFQASFEALADAQTEEKRRFLEEILLNSVRKPHGAARRVEALKAIELVSQISPDSILVFAALARLDRESDAKSPRPHSPSALSKESGLPSFLVYSAIEELAGELFLAYTETEEHDVDDDVVTEIVAVTLSHRGEWLQDWVLYQAKAEQGQTSSDK